MKKNDHYNQNSAPQLGIILKSFPYIRKAVAEIETSVDLTIPFTIVDYGCSQGVNSAAAIKEILSNLREKYSSLAHVLVVFNDQSTNDWTTLFKTVQSHIHIDDERRLTTLASGTSFYEQIMPSDSVNFAYTSTSIHWLSKIPCNITNHCTSAVPGLREEELQLWKQQAYNDYKLFLQNRSKELKKGGILLSVGPCSLGAHDTSGEVMSDNLYQSALAFLTTDEVLNFNVGTYMRTSGELTNEDLLKESHFQLILADQVEMGPSIYMNYKQGKITLDEYGNKSANFLRSITEASLKRALDTNRDEEDQATLIEQVYTEFARRVKLDTNLKLREENQTGVCSFVILRRI